jgi:hypothetical protein
MPTNFDDLIFVLAEINRFHEDPRSVFKEKWDAFYSLPHPSGRGQLPIGRAAARRFYDIAQRQLEYDSELKARVDIDEIERAIRHVFSEQILKEEKKLDRGVADRIVSRAIKHVKSRKLETRRHFCPCLLPGDPTAERFSVGPVTFTRTDVFLKSCKPKFKRYVDEYVAQHSKPGEPPTNNSSDREAAMRKHCKFYIDQARRYYRQYPWVVETEIAKFEKKKCMRAAKLAQTTALNVLRLFFSQTHAEGIGLAESSLPEPNSTRMWEMAGRIDISVHRHWAKYDDPGWVSKIQGDGPGQWLMLAGSLIPHLISGGKVPLLYQRFANALWWYGEAVAREGVPYLRVVSFCNALEAFLGTRKEKIAEQVSDRASKLLTLLHQGDQEWREKIKKLYDLRSGLVHGRIAAFDDEVELQVGRGFKIVQGTLLQGLAWMQCQAQPSPPDTVDDIQASYERLFGPYCRGELR